MGAAALVLMVAILTVRVTTPVTPGCNVGILIRTMAEFPGTAPLPPRLYKYLDPEYAEIMIAKGVVRFSSLSWFLNFEDDNDKERGDQFEGKYKFFPVDG